MGVDLTEYLPTTDMKDHLLPLLYKYIFVAEFNKSTSLRVFNGINFFSVLYEHNIGLDLTKLLQHVTRNYGVNLSISSLNFYILERLILESKEWLKYIFTEDGN